MTGKLEVSYRRVTPIETDLVFEGWIEEDRSRAMVARATCSAGGEVTAEARALFVRVDFGAVARRER
jgi:acyl-CoA thioesterase FadM